MFMKFVKMFIFSLTVFLVAAIFVLGNPKFAMADDCNCICNCSADGAAYSEHASAEGWGNPSWEKKTSGVEFQLGVGYLGAGNYSDWSSGFTFNLDVGYRWDWIGYTIDLGLGALGGYSEVFERRLFWFFGTLHACALFSYNRDKFELWGKLGAGVDFLGFVPILSFKAAIGVSYRVTETFGIGVDFAYMPLIAGSEAIHVISGSGHVRFLF